MTWSMSPRARSRIGTLVVAGVLIAIPAAAVGLPASAAPITPAVLPAPPPAEPPTNPPQPPPPPAAAQPGHGEYYSPNDTEDWWPYAGTGSF
jgi:hypothetical protein